jgi:TolA-binding protein
MNQKGRTIRLAALIAAAAALVSHAQTGRTGSSRGYATDTFEGFEALDSDTRIPQKETSFWFSVDEKTPAAQLQYAEKKEAQGRDRSARKAYEALIREWPTAPEAAKAQFALAQLQERRKKFEKAFDEYQYLLVHYAGHCPYQEVLDRQFRIANHLLHNNTSMFGWSLSGFDSIRERFEQLVRNAPRGAQAPEIMLIIGGIRVSEKELPEAVAVYEGLLNRFPQSPQAVTAAYLAAQCRHELAVKHSYNEPRCREAIAFIKAALARMPTHPQKAQMTVWLNELTALLTEQNYQQAVFYDTRQRNAEAAKAAYRRFLSEFSDSHYAQQVRSRLTELENGAAPLR